VNTLLSQHFEISSFLAGTQNSIKLGY